MKLRFKEAILFLAFSLVVSSFIYRDAMWGESLLAPLDMGPVAFESYDFMSDEDIDLPQNHFIVDQFTYDLPLQKRVYDSYRSGEIPWWDPYTYGGRPLLADAHINGTDPIRVGLYLLLPFELAYNWNFILRGILTGVGMFLLLRYAAIKAPIAAIFAITYQFSGWFTLYFGHPWIQGAFLYYPFIWLAWIKALDSPKPGPYCALAALLSAAVFYAGNIQSHTYLPLFALSFALTYLIQKREHFLKATYVLGISGIIGTLLASPVLINQLEFYLVSKRALAASADMGSEIISGALALPSSVVSTVYPWALGSFETTQPLRGFGAPGVELNLFFGSLTLLLITIAVVRRKDCDTKNARLLTQSVLLVVIYMVIICTPLRHLFYARCSALAGMGITFLCAYGMQHALKQSQTDTRKIIIGYTSIMLAGATLCTLFGKFIYPALLPKLKPQILEAYASKENITEPQNLERLRLHQIDNFPHETSMFHPEALLAILGVVCFSYALLCASRYKKIILVTGLILSSLPVALHHDRFRPKHPISMWERMQEGGPDQRSLMNEIHRSARVDERSKEAHQTIFPLAMPALYKVHHIQGYSALQPSSVYNTKPEDNTDLPAKLWGPINTNSSEETVTLIDTRFRYLEDGEAANIIVLHESMNQLTIQTAPENIGKALLRTDTFYPGWTCSAPSESVEPCFTKFHPSSNTVSFSYHPTGLKYGPWFAITGTVMLILTAAFGFPKTLSGTIG